MLYEMTAARDGRLVTRKVGRNAVCRRPPASARGQHIRHWPALV